MTGFYRLLELAGIITAVCNAILGHPLYLIAGAVIATYARLAQGRKTP